MGCNSVDPHGDSGFGGSVFEPFEPLLVKVVAVGSEVMDDLVHAGDFTDEQSVGLPAESALRGRKSQLKSWY